MSREKHFIRKTTEALALTGALLGAASAEAGGGKKPYEATELARLEERIAHIFGPEAIQEIKSADDQAQQETLERGRHRPEIRHDIPCKDGVVTRQEISRLLDLLPDSWFDSEVQAIEFRDEYDRDGNGKELKKVSAMWDPTEKVVVLFKPSHERYRFQVLASIIHEGSHAEGWLFSHNISYGQRLELVLATYEYDKADDHPLKETRAKGKAYRDNNDFRFLEEVAAYTVQDYMDGYSKSGTRAADYATYYLSLVHTGYDGETARESIRILADGTVDLPVSDGTIASNQLP